MPAPSPSAPHDELLACYWGKGCKVVAKGPSCLWLVKPEQMACTSCTFLQVCCGFLWLSGCAYVLTWLQILAGQVIVASSVYGARRGSTAGTISSLSELNTWQGHVTWYGEDML